VVRPVDTSEVRRLVERGAQLVDVLSEKTFANEHLPNAINIPLAEIEAVGFHRRAGTVDLPSRSCGFDSRHPLCSMP